MTRGGCIMKAEQAIDKIYMVTFTRDDGMPGRHLFLALWKAERDMNILYGKNPRLLVYRASLEGEIGLDGEFHPARVEGA